MKEENKVLTEFSEALRKFFNPDLSDIYTLLEKHPIKDESTVYEWNLQGKDIKKKKE